MHLAIGRLGGQAISSAMFLPCKWEPRGHCRRQRVRKALLWPCLLLLSGVSLALEPAVDFYLKPGDRVVFFGDSITDHRIYDTIVETFVVTRYPKLNVAFVHSGWGG